MKDVEAPPQRLTELPEATRKFLAGMRPEELARLRYLVEEFDTEDLQVINENLENMRVMKRIGRWGLGLAGAVAVIAGAITAVKYFLPGK